MKWTTTLFLPNGRRFFPEFNVGVRGRSMRDQIALIETKGNGVDGRPHCDINRMKITARCRVHANVKWAYEAARGWVKRATIQFEQIRALRPFGMNRLGIPNNRSMVVVRRKNASDFMFALIPE